MNTLDFYLELTSCYESSPFDLLKKQTLFLFIHLLLKLGSKMKPKIWQAQWRSLTDS